MKQVRRKVVIWLPVPAWWKLGLAVFLSLLVLASLSKGLPYLKTWTSWTMPLSGQVIVVDAGHGGIDGGAQSRDGLLEKDVNLAISLYLRDYLQEAGAVVRMTREKDMALAEGSYKGRHRDDLLRRIFLVEDSRADMLVSIHMNSTGSPKWSGAQTFFDPDSHPENRRLASLIQEELINNLETRDRTIKQRDNLLVLRSVEVPAVLVEVGFLSNPREAGLLSTGAYQKQVAASIYRGILRFVSGERGIPRP